MFSVHEYRQYQLPRFSVILADIGNVICLNPIFQPAAVDFWEKQFSVWWLV